MHFVAVLVFLVFLSYTVLIVRSAAMKKSPLQIKLHLSSPCSDSCGITKSPPASSSLRCTPRHSLPDFTRSLSAIQFCADSALLHREWRHQQIHGRDQGCSLSLCQLSFWLHVWCRSCVWAGLCSSTFDCRKLVGRVEPSCWDRAQRTGKVRRTWQHTYTYTTHIFSTLN